MYGGFAVFFCGLREEKVYLANLAVLLRGLYADHVKRLGFFCAPFADSARQRRGLLCFAVFLRGRPMFNEWALGFSALP